MSNNTDKFEINADLIDTTPTQAEQFTAAKPKILTTLSVKLDPAEMQKFGENIVANTCQEILSAINHGISKEDLIDSLEHAIHSNLESSGVQNDSSR